MSRQYVAVLEKFDKKILCGFMKAAQGASSPPEVKVVPLADIANNPLERQLGDGEGNVLLKLLKL